MDLRKIFVGLVVASALVSCSRATESDPVDTGAVTQKGQAPMTLSPVEQIPASSVPVIADELPSDACTLDGYWSFFEAFVRSPHVREKHTAPDARSALEPFRIALVDDRWYYVEAGREPGLEVLDLKESREGDGFTVEYAKAELGPDGEVVSTHGTPGRYVFRFKDGCWQLAGSAL